MKKFSIAMLLIVLLCSGALTASAQTGTTRSDVPNQNQITDNVFGLGGAFSLATGSGFSFRHHLPLIPFSYQITGYGWKSGFTAFSVGIELQYDLFVQEEGRLYVLAGASRYGYEPEEVTEEDKGLDDPNRMGIGVGYELPLTDAFGVAFNLTLTSFQPSGDLLPLPGAGAYIYF
jgi:opacity protein-like surface antigen